MTTPGVLFWNFSRNNKSTSVLRKHSVFPLWGTRLLSILFTYGTMHLYTLPSVFKRKQKFLSVNSSWFNCMEGGIYMMTGHWPFCLIFPRFPLIIFTTTDTCFSYFRLSTITQTDGPICGISAILNCWNQNHSLSTSVIWRAGPAPSALLFPEL